MSRLAWLKFFHEIRPSRKGTGRNLIHVLREKCDEKSSHQTRALISVGNMAYELLSIVLLHGENVKFVEKLREGSHAHEAWSGELTRSPIGNL